MTKASHASAAAFRDHPMMLACRREPAPYTPVWLMRQAGRYMPEYRRVRAQHRFLEMCRRPEIAAEVTVTAVERLGVDAAIIFADILLPLDPDGRRLALREGRRPDYRAVRSRSAADLDRIPPIDAAEPLGFVGDAIRSSRRALGGRYPADRLRRRALHPGLLPDRGRRLAPLPGDQDLMYTEPATWHRLMETLARATATISTRRSPPAPTSCSSSTAGSAPRARRLSPLRLAAYAQP